MHSNRQADTDRAHDALIEDLGKQRYLTLLAIHALDEMQNVEAHASFSYVRGVEAVNRIVASAAYLTAEDCERVAALKDYYRQASLMTVAMTYEGLLAQLERSYARLDRSPTLPRKTDGWDAFIEGATFGLIKAHND